MMKKQKEIIEILNQYKGEEEISSSQYPNTVKELKSFLSIKGFDFNETDFLISKTENNVDSDGYPYIKQSVIIMPVNVVAKMTAYHHEKWDFYIDNVITDKQDVFKNY